MQSNLSLLVTATRRRSVMLRVALLLELVLILNVVCFAQGPKPPLTPDERAELLKLIRDLQQRIEKLEAAQKPTTTTVATTDAAAANAAVASSVPVEPAPVEPPAAETTAVPVAEPAPAKQDDNDKFDGKYTPNLGYKVVNTEYGDMNISIYTYVRYLNQLGLDDTYTDAF